MLKLFRSNTLRSTLRIAFITFGLHQINMNYNPYFHRYQSKTFCFSKSYENPFPFLIEKMKQSVVTLYHRQTNRPIGQGVIIKEDGTFVTTFQLLSSEENASQYYAIIGKNRYNIQTLYCLSSDGISIAKLSDVKNTTFKPVDMNKEVQIGQQIYNVGIDHDEINVFQTNYILETFHTLSHIGISDDAIAYLSPFFISDLQNNSPKGSPILNSAGELLGIVMDIEYIQNKALIVSSYCLEAIKLQLNQNKKLKRGYAGISLKTSEQGGAFIIKINSDSPADQAGLKLGEVIKEIDGMKIQHATDVSKIFSYWQQRTFKLKVVRDNVERIINLTTE